MDQETAKKLLVEGGTFIFLGVPQETQFGIDMQCWNTDEDFRGIKMIPPGLHYVHYAAVNKDTGDVSPRSGFMHYFDKKEFLVKMWDKHLEDISREEISEESIQRLRENLLNIDKHLAPYPYEIWQKWKLLSSQINADLAKKLSPETGLIRSSVELLSTSDADRPRGVKVTENSEVSTITENNDEISTPSQSGLKRTRRSTQQEKEEAMLPNLKPAPGMSMRFTEIPKDKYPPGSAPQEITKHYLDQSYTLELMIRAHDEPLYIIGEMQFAFLCFLISHSLEAFEHWKSMVILFCSCEDAIHKYRSIYFHFIKTIEIQIDEMPEEFLADIVMNKNLVYKKLRELFRTAYMSKVDGRLLTLIERLKENLSQKLQWDFTGLDSDEDDERPVVVKLNDTD
ncbi:protein AAR2 homolog [Danaus plexippus]|uniref:protein AAR2 homolog n=1 Tax=Danaus plexippus TaxID=13037 RepID=UPI002AB227BA|nr:protein AAR2 homolog [Danaus plexippus]